jgi:hypothetical protein
MNHEPHTRARSDRFSIGVAMLLIAGASVGIWLVAVQFRSNWQADNSAEAQIRNWMYGFVFVLGGLSLVGPPLLLWTARRRHWGAGRFLWFTHGTAAWLLWPPVIYHRVSAGTPDEPMSGTCFFFGTPLMAVYVTLTLLAGGYFRRSRRRRLRRSWQETFGLLLGLAWACTGLYLISLFYRQDFLGK